jgi:hypothetical protein
MAKAVQIKKTIDDKDLQQMFGKLTGTVDPDIEVILPKYQRLHTNAANLASIMHKFANSPMAKVFRPKYPNGFRDADEYIATALKELKDLELEPNDHMLVGSALEEANRNPSKMQEILTSTDLPYKVHNIQERYKKLKDCKTLQEIVQIARTMQETVIAEKTRAKSETHNLQFKDKLSSAFIMNSDGVSLKLWPGLRLDFKLMIMDEAMNPEFKKYMIYILFLVYHCAVDVVKDLQTPDVDPEKFSQILVGSIDKMRAVPELSGCKLAFDKISKSVSLMKKNFGDYYKNFVVSRNPTSMIEAFIGDVSQNTKADLKTSQQFAKIINFYRNSAQKRGETDPKIKKMLDTVSEYNNILDSKLSKEKKSEEKDVSVDEDDMPRAKPAAAGISVDEDKAEKAEPVLKPRLKPTPGDSDEPVLKPRLKPAKKPSS